MSKKFFRPPVAFDESDDDDDDSEDEDNVSAAKPAPVSTNLSDDDDVSDDDDDSEEDEEETNKKRKGRPSPQAAAAKKPAPKKARPSLFDMEAFDDDDSDEEEDAAGEHMDETMLELIRQQDRSRGNRGGTFAADAADIETTARAIEQRHRQTNTTGRSAYASGAARGTSNNAMAMAPVAQQSLVPSVKDPRLWMVNCLTGKEQDIVYQLLRKCSKAAGNHQPIAVTAIIAAQSKGKLYIESYSEPAVMQLLAGVRGIMPSTKQIVPISDMTTVMTVVPSKQPVSVGDWVRLKRGHYRGDLAIVRAVKESGIKCIIQCVPRLDLQSLDATPEEKKRRKDVRPPQKFFSAQEVTNLGHHPTRQRFPDHLDSVMNCDYFENNYYHDGYWLKEMTLGTMVVPITKDNPPTIEELQNFQQRGGGNNGEYDNNNDGSKAASSLLEQISAALENTSSGATDGGLSVGDTIVVIAGELIQMQGKVVSVTNGIVKAQIQGVQEPVDFMLAQVRKHIPVGIHVKITDGRYANETGTVVAITEDDTNSNDPTAIVLTDITNHEISVRTSQLRESAEISSGRDQLSGYELYDLVVLSGGGSNNEMGIIVRVGREDFSIVINQSTVRESVRPEALRGKRNNASNKAVALDAKQQQLRSGDTVSVTEGLHKGKTATIKRMQRSVLFLHSQTRTEHAGIFVVRSKSCVLTGSQAMQRSGGGNDPFSTPGSLSTGGGGPRGGGGGRRAAEDNLMGKTVRIQAGKNKGMLGIVTDTTATHVQVELHARLTKVMVIRERVAVAGDRFGATENPGNTIPGHILPSASAMATPMHAIGGATPAIHGFGGATPAHDPDASDEVWRPGGAVDVAKDDETAQQEDNDDTGGGGWGSSANDNDEIQGWGSTNTTNNSGWGAPADDGGDEGMTHEASPPIGDGAVEPEETPPWFVERVCVNVKGVGDGIIQEITDNKATVKLTSDGTQQSVRMSEITMVVPQENDTVLVTGGVEIGLEGSLVCVDGSDAILKNTEDQFKIIDFVHLAKLTDS